jgi:membrane-associated phospholipid phosphatase
VLKQQHVQTNLSSSAVRAGDPRQPVISDDQDYKGVLRQASESQFLWIIIAAIVAIDAIWARSLKIEIVPPPLMVVGFVLLLGIHLFYSTLRPNERIAALALSFAQLSGFTAAGAVLTYLSVTSDFPLIDRQLAALDGKMGFNWLEMFHFVDDKRMIKVPLELAYYSAGLQVGLVMVLLNVLGQLERTREFVWLFVLSLMVIVPIAWLFPAESAWVYFGVNDQVDAYHLAHFNALRGGQMPKIAMAQVNGLITFPSFHASLAALFVYATRGISVLFPIALLLNAVMVASTPYVGGHYFVDIVAGLLVVPLAIALYRLVQRKRCDSSVKRFDACQIPDDC